MRGASIEIVLTAHDEEATIGSTVGDFLAAADRSGLDVQVLVAEDAIDGGHLLLRQRPDLVLADIEMPFMDGLEFLRAVKADRTTRSVPVIFVTVRVEAEAQAKKLGAAAFLTKPLFLPELLSTVAQHVEGRVAV